MLAAGTLESNSAAVRETLMNAIGTVFLPMAEKHAREEAAKSFAGTYVDEATNSSVTIKVDESGPPGLEVTVLYSRDVQIIGPESRFIDIYGAGQAARLYPSNLRTISKTFDGGSTYQSRTGFRAILFNTTAEGLLQDPRLMQWTSLGAPTYGAVTLDDWVFEMGEGGMAEVVDVRIFRLRMKRV